MPFATANYSKIPNLINRLSIMGKNEALINVKESLRDFMSSLTDEEIDYLLENKLSECNGYSWPFLLNKFKQDKPFYTEAHLQYLASQAKDFVQQNELIEHLTPKDFLIVSSSTLLHKLIYSWSYHALEKLFEIFYEKDKLTARLREEKDAAVPLKLLDNVPVLPNDESGSNWLMSVMTCFDSRVIPRLLPLLSSETLTQLASCSDKNGKTLLHIAAEKDIGERYPQDEAFTPIVDVLSQTALNTIMLTFSRESAEEPLAHHLAKHLNKNAFAKIFNKISPEVLNVIAMRRDNKGRNLIDIVLNRWGNLDKTLVLEKLSPFILALINEEDLKKKIIYYHVSSQPRFLKTRGSIPYADTITVQAHPDQFFEFIQKRFAAHAETPIDLKARIIYLEQVIKFWPGADTVRLAQLRTILNSALAITEPALAETPRSNLAKFSLLKAEVQSFSVESKTETRSLSPAKRI